MSLMIKKRRYRKDRDSDYRTAEMGDRIAFKLPSYDISLDKRIK